MNRRALLKLLSASALITPISALARPLFAHSLASADEAFLDDLERRACLYFAEQASPRTGQVLDRAGVGCRSRRGLP